MKCSRARVPVHADEILGVAVPDMVYVDRKGIVTVRLNADLNLADLTIANA